MEILIIIGNGILWEENIQEGLEEEIIFEDKKDFEYEEELAFQEV